MYRDWDFNESIGERNVRQTDESYGFIYLFFDAKQLNSVIKQLGKKNGQLLN